MADPHLFIPFFILIKLLVTDIKKKNKRGPGSPQWIQHCNRASLHVCISIKQHTFMHRYGSSHVDTEGKIDKTVGVY